MKATPSVEELLFTAVSGLDDPDQRRVLLDVVCAHDPVLRKRLEEMLALQPEADVFFQPVAEADCGRPARVPASEDGLEMRIGPYRLEERIGEGGCGVVYRAEQEEPVRRRVALKIIKLGIDTEAVVARFERERQALAQMDHPNIARVLEAGATTAGRPYFVMELVEGKSITDFCDRRRFRLRQRLMLFVQVCKAIQHAHQKGVIHRDIKPSNVLVDTRGDEPMPKVIDFGIAKETSARKVDFTPAEPWVGTPAYMSPEQAQGGIDIDTRSDIYSLGALLYELVCGVTPFELKPWTGVPPGERCRRIREEVPARPSVALKSLAREERARIAASRGVRARELVARLAGDIDGIVMKALEKERSQRYDSANGMAMDILRHLHDEPVLARPAGRLYRLGRLMRRNKLAFAAVYVALCGLLGGLAISTRMYFRERTARQEQVCLREQAEYRELIARAAVRLKYGNLPAAGALLAKVPVAQTPPSLETAEVFDAVAQWHLEAGRLQKAAFCYAARSRAISSVDFSDRAEISYELLPAAAVIAYANEERAYEAFRRFAIDRFAGTSNPQVAEQTLKACLLLPADRCVLTSLAPLATQVERAVELRQGVIGRRPSNAAWACFALALWEHRAGHPQKAEFWVERCQTFTDPSGPRTVGILAIGAMGQHVSGDRKKAVERLAIARKMLDEALPQGRAPASADLLRIGFDWVNAVVLLAEAERKAGVE